MASFFKIVVKPHKYLTEKYLQYLQSKEYFKVLKEAAERGVKALSDNTPVDTGLTAASWSYEIDVKVGTTTICWKNSNVTKDGDPVAILLQYGHGTGTGGYVVGVDYINPAIKPVFDNIAELVWKAVVQA